MRLLYNLGINWSIMGDLSLYLHQLNIRPGKIELLTDENGIYILENELVKRKYKVIENVNLVIQNDLISHRGRYMIHGVELNTYAGFIIKMGDIYYKVHLRDILPYCKSVELNEKLDIIITPLEFELVRLYLQKDTNREKKINLILEKLEKIDHELVNMLTENLPKDKREKIISLVENK